MPAIWLRRSFHGQRNTGTQVCKRASAGGAQFWKLHLGDSFTDVPRAQPFYRKIETLLHTGSRRVAAPPSTVPATRSREIRWRSSSQRRSPGPGKAFRQRARYSSPAFPLDRLTTALPAGHLFFDIDPTDIFCKHVHYLAAENVTLGRGGFKFFPGSTVTLDAMASFIAKAVVAPQGGAGAPEPSASRAAPTPAALRAPTSTSRRAGELSLLQAHPLPLGQGDCLRLFGRRNRPGQPVNRDAMAKSIANGFGLQLYGP